MTDPKAKVAVTGMGVTSAFGRGTELPGTPGLPRRPTIVGRDDYLRGI
jgi:hypothetical protein